MPLIAMKFIEYPYSLSGKENDQNIVGMDKKNSSDISGLVSIKDLWFPVWVNLEQNKKYPNLIMEPPVLYDR